MKKLLLIISIFLLVITAVSCARWKCEHQWDAGVLIDAEECAPGVQAKFKCVLCGKTKKDDASEHYYSAKNTIPATCTEMGYGEMECARCDAGEHFISEFVNPTGHKYGEAIAVKPEKCTENGLYDRVCSVCGDTFRYSTSARGHNYVAISEENWQITYECSECGDVIVLGDNETLDMFIGNDELFDVETSFTFDIVSSDSEATIRENLTILDNYFNFSEHENHPEALVDYKLESKGDNVWTVYVEPAYDYDTTYIVKLGEGISFADYKGKELFFTTIEDPDHENSFLYKDKVLFLHKLENEIGGYYPYSLGSTDQSGFLYLTVNKLDGLNIGQIICVGEVMGFDEITSDTECYFGVVSAYYPLQNGQYMIALSEPELQEIFEELNVIYKDSVSFDDESINVEQLKADIVDSLYNNEEFVEFLSVLNVSASKYFEDNGFYAVELSDTKKFLNSISLTPSVSFSGNTLYADINGTLSIPINKNGKNIGSFSVSFTVGIQSSFDIDVSYSIKTKLSGIKFDHFDIAVTQNDNIQLTFEVAIDLFDMMQNDYVRNKINGEVHRACCVAVGRARDKNAFEGISEDEAKNSNSKCALCRPGDSESTGNGFDTYYADTLYCSDWQQVSKDISEFAGGNSTHNKGVTLASVKIPICGPVSVQFDLDFVLSLDLRAALTYEYSYKQTNIYGMRLTSDHVQPYSQSKEIKAANSNLSLIGSAEIRIGLAVDMAVNISGFEKWINAGVYAEVGAYASLNGIIDLTQNYSGAYFESGAYLDINAYYKVIRLSDSIDIVGREWPLLTEGYEKLYFAYEVYRDRMNIQGCYDIDENNLLAVKYLNLKDMSEGTHELSLTETEKYRVNISFVDGSYCEIRNGKIAPKTGAPERFSDTIIITVTSGSNWNKYKKNSEVYYLGEYRIHLDFDSNAGHNYTEGTKVSDATCLVRGEIHKDCLDCGYAGIEYIPKLKHDFQYIEANDITVCQNCNSMKFNGHIYHIYTNTSTWDSAKAQCEAVGGHLATITSEEEQAAFERFMNYLKFTGRTWIGGYKNNGAWKWVTNEAFDYNKWNSGEPNNDGGNEYALEVNISVLGGWNDLHGGNRQNYYCEWESE